MTATVIVQPEAESDLAEAFRWYEQRSPGLGDDFLDEIDRVFGLIAENPLLTAPVWRAARRAIPRRFPYVVIYVERGDRVYVLGVLHQRRNPSLTRHRTGDFEAG